MPDFTRYALYYLPWEMKPQRNYRNHRQRPPSILQLGHWADGSTETCGTYNKYSDWSHILLPLRLARNLHKVLSGIWIMWFMDAEQMLLYNYLIWLCVIRFDRVGYYLIFDRASECIAQVRVEIVEWPL